MKPPFVLGGLFSEAWARSVGSYSRSMEYYNIRVKEGTQPTFPYINIFEVNTQNNFLCVANCLYLIITIALYTYMKKRSTGFRLRWVLVVYDALNVIVAFYIAFSTIQYKIHHGGLLLCNPIVNDPEGYRIARVFVLFYLQKYLEFFDTWFFILRKSSRQVTFLHLFHHSSITVVVGSILPFDYNGDMYLPILLNSTNHMMVYLHYLLATLGLRSWWAPYITSMQLVQFCIIFGQSLLSYRIGPTCGSPDFAKVLMIIYMGSMVALFGHFFLQKYVLQRPSSSLDMWGVIKRPQMINTFAPTQHCGCVQLDEKGNATISLPEDFPDPERVARMSLRFTPFQATYSLTPIGAAMPQLHVSRTVGRLVRSGIDLQNVKSNSSFPTVTLQVAKKKKKGNKLGKGNNNSNTQLNEKSFDKDTNGLSKPTVVNKIHVPIEATSQSYDSNKYGKSQSAGGRIQNNSNDLITAASNQWEQFEQTAGGKNDQGVTLMPKSASFNDFQSDRLIDGPLPVIISDSINTIRSANSRSVGQLLLSTFIDRSPSHQSLASAPSNTDGSISTTPPSDPGSLYRRTSSSSAIANMCHESRDYAGEGGLPQVHSSQSSDISAMGGGTGDPGSHLEGEVAAGRLRAASQAVSQAYLDQPLSFSVGGGVPGQWVSWMIYSVPIKRPGMGKSVPMSDKGGSKYFPLPTLGTSFLAVNKNSKTDRNGSRENTQQGQATTVSQVVETRNKSDSLPGLPLEAAADTVTDWRALN